MSRTFLPFGGGMSSTFKDKATHHCRRGFLSFVWLYIAWSINISKLTVRNHATRFWMSCPFMLSLFRFNLSGKRNVHNVENNYIISFLVTRLLITKFRGTCLARKYIWKILYRYIMQWDINRYISRYIKKNYSETLDRNSIYLHTMLNYTMNILVIL